MTDPVFWIVLVLVVVGGAGFALWVKLVSDEDDPNEWPGLD